jgi:hypothetical protein
MDLQTIKNNLEAACLEQVPKQLSFVLFQIAMRGLTGREFVSKAFVEHALDLEKAQKFLDAGVSVDATYQNSTPLTVSLMSGGVDDVAFYLKKGADPNKTFGDVDNWFYAVHSPSQNNAKMRELLLAGSKSNHVIWWNNAWFLPWSPLQYSLMFPLGVNHLALKWLWRNRGRRKLELLAQDGLYERALNYIVACPIDTPCEVGGGG